MGRNKNKKQPELSTGDKKKRLKQLIDARKMQMGAIQASNTNFQESIKGMLTIDDALLNLLLKDSPLAKES